MTPLDDNWKTYIWELVKISFALLAATSFCVEVGIAMDRGFIIMPESVYCMAATLTLAASLFTCECVPCLFCLIDHYAVVPKISFPVKYFLVLLYIHTVIMFHHIAAIMVTTYFEGLKIETWTDF